MARDEDDDLYDEEFDFVDDDDEADDDDESAVEDADDSPMEDAETTDEPARAAAPRGRVRGRFERADEGRQDANEAAEGEEVVDEYGRPEPVANYVVHVYENRKFKRTIERPFTPEDAEAFATEFNRTSKHYNRMAVTGKNDAKPKKSLDEK
jgi:hypothetical protein